MREPFAKGEELGCRDCVTHDRGHGGRAALSASSADCEAAPRCTCCNNVPRRLIHRRLSASSDSYDGRLCKTSRVHARAVCVCVYVCVSTRANQHLARRRQRRRDRERIFPRADSRHTADKKSCGETWRGRDDESVGNKEWRKINGIVHGSPDYFGNRFWIFFFGNWGDGVAGEGT